MSGVFGAVDSERSTDVDALTDEMARAMSHREWFVTDHLVDRTRNLSIGRIGIGIFNRERQPVYSEDQSLVIFLSGELHNTAELRRQLKAKRRPLRDDGDLARPLAAFLDKLERDHKLAKTILYNLNPRDNDLVAAMIGNFQDGSVPGKMQFGAAWWFNDQKQGIERQLRALSNAGLLSRFVGMLTDSRSFLSYPRHEYFRRILCNLLGNDVENGELPADLELLGGMVQDICYNNAVDYFGFDASFHE